MSKMFLCSYIVVAENTWSANIQCVNMDIHGTAVIINFKSYTILKLLLLIIF